MKQRYRDGRLVERRDRQERMLSHLYGHAAGRLLLRPLIRPRPSRLIGCFLSTRLSRPLIRPFVRIHRIDMQQFLPEKYDSYNAFFCRRIRPSLRPIDTVPGHLIAPCDSKLTALPITKSARFSLKQTSYTLDTLLRDAKLAAEFTGGWALIFRLTVEDYHRYCYVDGGEKTENHELRGKLHTVHPIANDHYPIYKENSRSYCLLHSENFGTMLMMEVGALLVGRIVNHHGAAQVTRGQEKGYFQFGGSTVVLLLKADSVRLDPDILENSVQGIETVVRMGERIAVACPESER